MKLSEFQKRVGFKISKQLLFEYIKRFGLTFEKDEVKDNIYTDQHLILFKLIWALTHKVKYKDPDIKVILDAITVGTYKQTLNIKINPQEVYRDNFRLRQENVDLKRERDQSERFYKKEFESIRAIIKKKSVSSEETPGFFRRRG